MLADANYTVLSRESLPFDGNTYEFQGFLHDNTQVSFIWVDMAPGRGVRLHEHPYKEIFVIQEGTAAFTVGSATLEARAGQVIIVPADTPHKFMNAGSGQLRQVDIHVSSRFITHWLEA